ncbi:hypothetical protein FPZ43_14810 [Mucilaginibacter pallidiroseus]|uniref:TonB-dependent receptor plug domain-containing protein n=1 Tax=Mucilaginibacter pallidiroseus TaxID=2599295 RepID=A0A563U509_9SPHI|nr:TonB-dependent receptor plug domain-containing protein [Mucilaginibacter pallidiroseus]TWR26431.1 hypothetical protein FPZ43_14810 [Mucilaginibacter pallidiroseus]
MKKPLLMVFACICLQYTLHAQTTAAPRTDNDIKQIVSKLQTTLAATTVERVYIHSDKPYYDPGDTIYFKAYVTAGSQHQISKGSSVLYADLIGKNDSLMQSIILQLDNGQAHGDFELPKYLTKGNYRIRAYTQFMQSQGGEYLSYRTISVTGHSLTKVTPAAANPDVQFFAEGGSFVAGLPSRISFKAVGADGLGINIKGTVVDNLNKVVGKFTTARVGLGQFFLTPEDGKTYRAKVTYPDGKTASVDLPKAVPAGMTLTVNNDAEDKMSVEINANKAFYLANKNKELAVVIYNAGIVKTVKAVLDNQSLGFDLAKKDLRTGVAQVTLFLDGSPVNERLAFIQNRAELNVMVNSDKAAYARGDNVQLNLNAKTADSQKQSTGYFSLSVVNDTKVPTDENRGNIVTDLLLTPELTGYVEQPGYYFNNPNADTRKSLDLLMLTQGYRGFVWKDVLTGNILANSYVPKTALQVSGVLLNQANQPVPNNKVVLMAKQSGLLLNSQTDGDGRFVFDKIAFMDRTGFLLKIDNATTKNKLHVVLDKTHNLPPIPADSYPSEKTMANLPEGESYANNDNLSNPKLSNALLTNKNAVYRSSNLAGAGNADQVIYKTSFRNASTLTTGLDGVARGIRFEAGKAYQRARIVGSNAQAFNEPMLLVVDGTITSADIDSFNPNDVETVEILRGSNASIYGMAGGAGVIVINTKQGGESEPSFAREMSPGVIAIMPQGFYAARQFYTPNINTAINNPRKTIMWNPDVVTDKNGNAVVSFNSNSPAGTYRVTVEGIDANGYPAASVTSYTVK